MRTLKRNKNTKLRYSNRIPIPPEGKATENSYGDILSEYGEIKEISLFVVPLQNEFEARYYGVDRYSSLKVIMSLGEAALFDKFTRVWVDAEPNEAKNNNDYYVSSLPTNSLNISAMILTKVDGR